MTNYTYPKNEDVEIVVGDEKQDDFKPRMKIKRWDNEVNFSVGLISDHKGSDQKITDKVEWDDGHGTKAKFYHKPDNQFEFEIELSEKPVTNVLRLSIETKGLDFFYQPELTLEEIEKGHSRPENVIGSYAVYHKTMQGDYSQCGGKNYRAGKAFHIYRPYAMSVDSKQVWCDMDITDGVMSITIPQEFLDTAKYPVVVDPTLGCDPASPGASWCEWWSGNALAGPTYTTPVNIDTVQSMSAYVRKDPFSGTNFYAKGVIVLFSSFTPITNGVGEPSDLVTDTNGVWALSTFGTDPTPAVLTDHILMAVSGPFDYPMGNIAYDAAAAGINTWYDLNNSYDSPQTLSIYKEMYSNWLFSVYCTYTQGVNLACEIPAETSTTDIIIVSLRELVAVINASVIGAQTPFYVERNISTEIPGNILASNIEIEILLALIAEINTGTGFDEALLKVVRDLSTIIPPETLVAALDLIVSGFPYLDTELLSQTVKRTLVFMTPDRTIEQI